MDNYLKFLIDIQMLEKLQQVSYSDNNNSYIFKEEFSFNRIKNNLINVTEFKIFNYYNIVLYQVNVFAKALKCIYNYFYNDNEKELLVIFDKLNNEIKEIIFDKSYLDYNMDINSIKKIYDNPNELFERKNIDMSVHILDFYLNNLKEIIELLYDTDNFINNRRKFLNRDDGIKYANLLNLLKK